MHDFSFIMKSARFFVETLFGMAQFSRYGGAQRRFVLLLLLSMLAFSAATAQERSSSSARAGAKKKSEKAPRKAQKTDSLTPNAKELTARNSSIIFDNSSSPIIIGMNLVESDPLDLPQWRAAQMAVEEINAAGGVLERKLELAISVSPNRQYDKVYPGVKRLIDSGITCIIVPDGSDLTLKLASLTIVRDVLLMATSSTSPELSLLKDNDLVWRTAPSDIFQGKIVAYLLDSMNIKDAAVLYVNNVYGQGLFKNFQEAFAKKGGSITRAASYPALSSYRDYDFREKLDSLYESRPTAVYIISDIEDGIKIFMQSQIYGFFTPEYKPKLIGCDANYSNDLLFAVNPSVIEGMIGLSYARPSNSLVHNAFIARFQRFLQEIKDTSSFAFNILDGLVDPETTDAYASTTYDAVYALAFAIAKGKSIAAADIASNLRLVCNPAPNALRVEANEFAKAVNALKQGKRIHYVGASGPVEFDDNGDIKSGTYTVWRVQQGRYVVSRVVSFP
jgi:ABC-type branched-subunit amino acid transport system substrate-binding protein